MERIKLTPPLAVPFWQWNSHSDSLRTPILSFYAPFCKKLFHFFLKLNNIEIFLFNFFFFLFIKTKKLFHFFSKLNNIEIFLIHFFFFLFIKMKKLFHFFSKLNNIGFFLFHFLLFLFIKREKWSVSKKRWHYFSPIT